MRSFLFLIALVPGGALAQSSTTTCSTIGAYVRCDTRPAPGSDGAPLDYGAILNSGRNAVPVYRAPSPEERRQSSSDRLRRAVGKMVIDGNCDGAESLALQQGDLSLARSVRDYCGGR